MKKNIIMVVIAGLLTSILWKIFGSNGFKGIFILVISLFFSDWLVSKYLTKKK